MPPSVAEDITFVLFFYSFFMILQIITPYIYSLFCINTGNYYMMILFWLCLLILFIIIFKYLQSIRYKEELNDIENTINGNLGGFDL